MLDLRPEHAQRYEQVAKGRAARQPHEDPPSPQPTPAADSPAADNNGHAAPMRSPSTNPRSHDDAELMSRLAECTDLMEFLRFGKFKRHAEQFELFYLWGWACHHGARSGNRVFKMIDDPPAELLNDGLAKKVRENLIIIELEGVRKMRKITRKQLFDAVPELEGLLSNTPLVNRLGGGLPFCGLTEAGELFWRKIADFLRKYL